MKLKYGYNPKKRRKTMKKLFSLILCLVLAFGTMATLTACLEDPTYDIAVITDVGTL